MRAYGLPVDTWSMGILLHELLTGLHFAGRARSSKRISDRLMFSIARLAGPITEETWPGVSSLQHWPAHAPIVAAAAATSLGSPWDASRRAVCPAGRALADALLRVLPSRRVTAKQALEYAFCSGGASVPAAPCNVASPVAMATASKATQTAAVSGATEGTARPTGGAAPSTGARETMPSGDANLPRAAGGSHEDDVAQRAPPPPEQGAVEHQSPPKGSPPQIRVRSKLTADQVRRLRSEYRKRNTAKVIQKN